MLGEECIMLGDCALPELFSSFFLSLKNPLELTALTNCSNKGLCNTISLSASIRALAPKAESPADAISPKVNGPPCHAKDGWTMLLRGDRCRALLGVVKAAIFSSLALPPPPDARPLSM
eukprot:CCRYP_004812-RA/>CCRYP_004812-RA protein AED:0.38 eAED:0.64 QI:241/0/0.5/1/0/0/2/0/118